MPWQLEQESTIAGEHDSVTRMRRSAQLKTEGRSSPPPHSSLPSSSSSTAEFKQALTPFLQQTTNSPLTPGYTTF